MISTDTDLILPDSLREELRKPFGQVVECSEIPKLVKPGDKIIAIGDSVSTALILAGLSPSMIVWDGRSQRHPLGEGPLRILRKYAPLKKVRNPPATITKAAWSLVSDSLQTDRASIFVDGEEDLLAIPAILNSGDGTKIVYGFPPKKGAILIDVDSKTRAVFQDILSRFEKSGN
jgi:uncharacterized protein (UPF0218 family)